MPPVPDSENLRHVIESYISSNKVIIFSKTTCPYCTKVKELFTNLKVEFFALELDQLENGRQLQQALSSMVGRTSVPQVFINSEHIGGCDDTMTAHSQGKLAQLLELNSSKYDFDLIVIGGGSGGLSASKTAANLGKKVAVLDFVKPTPTGTTWGLGGTCVNVGCIPKKLMHQAALLGHSIEDASKFGWELPEKVTHNWHTMKTGIQNYIKSLNWGYRVQLREKTVQYLNSYGEFVDEHTVKATDKKGQEKLLTAENFLIATGERPRYPEIPGAKEYGITSDDLFSLPYCPGKTLVIGASYVALECAGFLAGIGLDVTIMVRSILLRGFDQDMAERIGEYMKNHSIKFVRPCVPVQVISLEEGKPGKLKVIGQMTDTQELFEDEFNIVLFAMGRISCTSGIGLETVGVDVNLKNGKIPTVNEQTNVPHIYAIGDVLEGKPELTPVAIEAGMLLAKRLYGGSTIQCDYINVATTVFTPLEYGCIGYSEEAAIQAYGEDNIEVYHSTFTPLEWSVPHREDNVCYSKLICLIPENEQIIGFHYLGPNAGEITQGYAFGIKKGITKADVDATIGIHPTCSEVFTTLTVTKRSGKSIAKSGC